MYIWRVRTEFHPRCSRRPFAGDYPQPARFLERRWSFHGQVDPSLEVLLALIAAFPPSAPAVSLCRYQAETAAFLQQAPEETGDISLLV